MPNPSPIEGDSLQDCQKCNGNNEFMEASTISSLYAERTGMILTLTWI
jgi:hypothetical protein